MFKVRQSSLISLSAAPIFLGALGSLRLRREADSAQELNSNQLRKPRKCSFPTLTSPTIISVQKSNKGGEQRLTYFVALIVFESSLIDAGAAHLKLPTGGSANGTPRYSET
jgi:hypothetical protein